MHTHRISDLTINVKPLPDASVTLMALFLTTRSPRKLFHSSTTPMHPGFAWRRVQRPKRPGRSACIFDLSVARYGELIGRSGAGIGEVGGAQVIKDFQREVLLAANLAGKAGIWLQIVLFCQAVVL